MISKRSSVLFSLAALHPVVDACTAALFMAIMEDVWQVFLYNFVAFALQLPIGWVLDARPVSLRRLLVIAGGFLLCGVGAYSLFGDPVVAIVLACLGNAVFHMAAGKHLLDDSDGKAARVSAFISTGMIGLMAGMRFGADFPLIMIGGALLAYLLLTALSWRMFGESLPLSKAIPPVGKIRPLGVAVVIVLGIIVVWRSYGVLTTTSAFSSAYSSIAFVIALAFNSWLGQFVSGWMSDRYGRVKILSLSLVGSAILFWACPTGSVVGWLVLLFCAQLATGPVMGLLYDGCGGRSGLAFGVNCLALFVGTLFIRCPNSALYYLAGDFLAIALEFAATAWIRLPCWFGALVCVNMCTHPALVYSIHRVGYSRPVAACGEIGVVLVEFAILSLLYRRQRIAPLKLFGVVVWMNAVSYLVGVCLFGW